jgi:hypothetical protein
MKVFEMRAITLIDADLRFKDLDAMQIEIEKLPEVLRREGVLLMNSQRASIYKATCTSCQRHHATATVRVWLQKARNRVAASSGTTSTMEVP